jgi:hypothetical protein
MPKPQAGGTPLVGFSPPYALFADTVLIKNYQNMSDLVGAQEVRWDSGW